jgi:uncharacterized membrane protein YfcA
LDGNMPLWIIVVAVGAAVGSSLAASVLPERALHWTLTFILAALAIKFLAA